MRPAHSGEGAAKRHPVRASDARERQALRRSVAAALAVVSVPNSDKDSVRQRHAQQRQQHAVSAEKLLHSWRSQLLPFFARGSDVDPARIDPEVRVVESDLDASLYRTALLNWSVPVTSGFGRRTRFLVIDRSNGKLIGVFCLSDPVYNLAARETHIRWSPAQKRAGLYRVLDASVLGALPPYSFLLAGKLVALCALSEEALTAIQRKYAGHKTVITRRTLDARPLLITTTSALGRSSIYNRLRVSDRTYYERIGWTKGFGTFQLPPELFSRVVAFLEKHDVPEAHRNRFGNGPNWKLRVLRVALEQLSLPKTLQQHGIRREVFAAPTARNWREALVEETSPDWYRDTAESLAQTYRTRWAIPRAARVDYRGWDPQTGFDWLRE